MTDKYDPKRVIARPGYLTDWERLFRDLLQQMVIENDLKFTHNPGGGCFYRDDLGMCQVPAVYYEEDCEILSQWLSEKGENHGEEKD